MSSHETDRGWAARSGKQAYLDRIAPATFAANADNLIDQLAEVREGIVSIRGKLRAAVEAIQTHEAGLTLSDGYAAGKNAETRSAWLKLQRTTDDDLRALVARESELTARLAEAEAEHDYVGRQYELAKLEIRLAIASLNFMTGGE